VIGLNPDATPRDPKAAGAVHFADAVEPLEDLINAYLRLEAEGIIPHGCIGHGFTTSLYYTSLHYPDPDGNEAELQVDDDQSRESMDAWLRAGASDRNFAGQPFDPARKAELHRAGVPEERILQQELYR
jgi:catechol-2,3-dioxygenase